ARRVRAPALAARSGCGAGTRLRGQGVSAGQAQGGPAIGVIGAGAWGTALAQMLASDGREVLLWAREEELVEQINVRRANPLFVAGADLAASIRATVAVSDAVACTVLLLVTPAQLVARVIGGMAELPQDLVVCAKGIDAASGRMMHE